MNEVELLKLWRERANKSAAAHYRVASSRFYWNRWLSAIVVFATTFVGSGLAVTLSKQNSQFVEATLAVLGVLAAILAGLQRVLSLAEMAERHRAAGAHWDAIFNSMCLLAASGTAPPMACLEELKKEMDDLVARSPSIPEGMFKKVSLKDTYARLSEEGR